MAWVAAAAAVEPLRKWTDEGGGVHYGDHAPPGSATRTVPIEPGPDEAESARSRERFERVEEYLEGLARERAPAGGAEPAPPRLPQVPMVHVQSFRCARGGLVSVGESVETLLRKCGPPQSTHGATWRYAGYGRFAHRLKVTGGAIRGIHRETRRVPLGWEPVENPQRGDDDVYDEDAHDRRERWLREERARLEREAGRERDQDEDEPDEPSYHRFGGTGRDDWDDEDDDDRDDRHDRGGPDEEDDTDDRDGGAHQDRSGGHRFGG